MALKKTIKECEIYGQSLLTDTCIFIASHIKYVNQINLLDKCLKSLINQKCAKCNIYLSISFDNENYKNEFLLYHGENKNNLRGYEYLLKHKFADMYLSMFLQYYSQNFNDTYITLLIPENLYNYNINNNNSLCAKKESPVNTTGELIIDGRLQLNKDYFRNGIILSLICKDYSIIKKNIKCWIWYIKGRYS